jgi:hypothetical protein
MTLTLALLTTSLLFGGMTLFSFSFAAFLFSVLPPDMARQAIRRVFPYFYLFVILTAFVASLLLWPIDRVSFGLLVFVMTTAVISRQILMPAINHATDAEMKIRFKWLHALSVALTLLHIGLSGWILARFV